MNHSRPNASLPRPTANAYSRQNPQNEPSAGHRNSGIGAAFLSADSDDDEPDHRQQPTQPTAPLRTNTLPLNPSAGRQQSHNPSSLRVDTNMRVPQSNLPPYQQQPPQPHPTRSQPQGDAVARPPREADQNRYAQPIPRPPRAAFIPESGTPSNLAPHPLQAPKTPITPAFARPSPAALQRPGVKFSDDALLRGNSEDTLLSRSTPKGADFWRRFSVVVKEEHDTFNKPGNRSTWLVKHEASASRMRGCVWIVAIVILIAIGGLATLVWFMTHNNAPSAPKTLSGAADPSNTFSSSSSSTFSSQSSSSKALHTVTGDLPPTAVVTPTIGQRAVETNFVKRDTYAHDSLRRRHRKERLD
jgi:hypothetical protein